MEENLEETGEKKQILQYFFSSSWSVHAFFTGNGHDDDKYLVYHEVKIKSFHNWPLLKRLIGSTLKKQMNSFPW